VARIDKTEYPRILTLVDVDKRKVAEVAALYGCTPANIYALLGKLRRTGVWAAAAELPGILERSTASASKAAELSESAEELADSSTTLVISETARDLKVETPIAAPSPDKLTVSAPQPTSRTAANPASDRAEIGKSSKREAVTGRSGFGSSFAKFGFGLAMRTAEGDENVTPFRSLDDLLSAVKPILRAAARSPDAVWFSIQSIDLATLESDAA